MEAIGFMHEFGQPIETIVHIGANNGLEAASYFATGAKSVMYVEPIPSVFAELCARIDVMPGHFAVNALCSSSEGEEFDFNLADNHGESSSIFALGNHAILHPEVTFVDKMRITSTTVDAICRDHEVLNHISLLVLDVQGAETVVLSGALETLKQTSAVYCEVSDIRIYENGCTWQEVADLLDSSGFTMKYLRTGVRHYGNAFFLKKDKFFD